MFDSRKSFQALLASPDLDSLIDSARKEASKIASAAGAIVQTQESINVLGNEAEKLAHSADAASEDLSNMLAEREARKAEKVAEAVHIYRTCVALLS